jgi:EAL domain-containing protein (putative c-di-GMP-specific phosphodiesterase class I)
MIVNIKNFSRINILHGYETGDRILKQVATVLQNSCAIKSYRIYGDEFAVLVPNESEAHTLFDKLNTLVSYKVGKEQFDVFFYGAYDRFGEKALEGCEFALLKGDRKGLVDSNRVKDLLQAYEASLTLTQRLKEAMLKDDIVPYFQPIYTNGRTNRVIKYEVLMRVRDGDGVLEPREFLDTLKESPFYTEFTKSILFKAFELFKDNDIPFSVNFTLTDIKDKGVRLFLETLIARYPHAAKRLTIEITENEALEEFDLLNEFITTFRRRGVTFSLDDFGSGYANFAQIAKLDIDFIKIDGSIVQELPVNDKMWKLLESIQTFAHSLDLRLIAEFVSNKTLFDMLKERVDLMQGYYIGKPAPHLRDPFEDEEPSATSR